MLDSQTLPFWSATQQPGEVFTQGFRLLGEIAIKLKSRKRDVKALTNLLQQLKRIIA